MSLILGQVVILGHLGEAVSASGVDAGAILVLLGALLWLAFSPERLGVWGEKLAALLLLFAALVVVALGGDSLLVPAVASAGASLLAVGLVLALLSLRLGARCGLGAALLVIVVSAGGQTTGISAADVSLWGAFVLLGGLGLATSGICPCRCTTGTPANLAGSAKPLPSTVTARVADVGPENVAAAAKGMAEESHVGTESAKSGSGEFSVVNTELLESRRKFLSLVRLFQQLSTVRDENVVCANTVRYAKDETRSKIVLFMIVEQGTLRIAFSQGVLAHSVDSFSQELGEGVFGRVAASGTMVRFGPEDGGEWRDELGLDEEISSLLAVPMSDLRRNLTFGVLAVANKRGGGRHSDDDVDFLTLLASEAGAAVSSLQVYSELERSYNEIIQALAQAIEAKDPYTHGHVARVENYAVQLAKAINLSVAEVELIAKAAVLHDVGKLSVPDKILTKPGALTEEELVQMRAHATNACLVLKDIHSLPRTVLDMVVHHHERYDGCGYPDGLAAQDIPVGAQIIAIADTFDAMTSDRPYRKGFTVAEALRRMEATQGKQFDPELLRVFLSLHKNDAKLADQTIDFSYGTRDDHSDTSSSGVFAAVESAENAANNGASMTTNHVGG